MTSTKNIENTKLFVVSASLLLLSLAFIAFLQVNHARAEGILTGQMGVGAQGPNVTMLQQFLATNSRIYPQGLVTGNYGPLTQAAVKQFQIAYEIASPATPGFGRVGAITLARINTLLTQGLAIDVSAPEITKPDVTTGSNSATITWQTNEQAKSRVYYNTSPLYEQEVLHPFQEPLVNGQLVSDLQLNSNHEIMLSGLSRGTQYYYQIVTFDSAGNVSLSQPGTFSTD